MPNSRTSVFIVLVFLIKLNIMQGRDFGDSFLFDNEETYNYGVPLNNYQPSHQLGPRTLPQNKYPGPYTSPNPYYPYQLPTVISLDGNNNNNGNRKSKKNDDNFNMFDILSLWIGSQNDCPVYLPYPIPIPIPCMADGDDSWLDVFKKEQWEDNGWFPDPSSGRKRKRGRSNKKGKSTKQSKSNTQTSHCSTNKNKHCSGKSDTTKHYFTGKKSARSKPQKNSTVEYDDQKGSATIQAGCNMVTISYSKPDNDYDKEGYVEEEEPCNANCDKKKVYRTQIVIETS
nr:uncharacterized protein LOC128669776 [Plodia interpunctella]